MKKLRLSTLKDKTFREGFEEFIFNCKARGLREATIHHYKESYAQIIRYMDKDMEIKDIDKNPKDLKIDAKTAPEMLVQMYKNEEGDAVVINSNYAIDAGLTPTKDSISIEDSESPYVNVIAVRKGDEDKKEIKELMKALHSKEIQDYINKEWEGSVVPVNE